MSSSIGRKDGALANASNRRKVLGNASNSRKVLASASNRHPAAVDPLPGVFRLSFGPVTSNLVSLDLSNFSPSVVKSFNIWCCEENEDIFSKGPVSSFLCDRPKTVSISNLRPGTKYMFGAVAYGDKGEVGCFQVTCSTMSVDTNRENLNPPGPANLEKGKNIQGGNCSNAAVEHIQEGNCSNAGVEHIQEGNFSNAGVEHIQEGNFSNAGVERDCGGAEEAVREMHSSPTTHGRSHVPDLNEDGGLLPDLNENGVPVFDLNEDSGTVPDLHEDYERAEVPPTTGADSALVDDRPPSGGFEGKFGECVKTIGRLERNGHLETEFGMKFLTWFTLRSTSEQKSTVSLFIEALGDDDQRLAKQLVDTFSGKISNKRLKQ